MDQERAPVFTAISLLTTIVVQGIIIVVASATYTEMVAIYAALVLAGPVLLTAVVVNSVVGIVASVRGEYWGGRIAAMGIALWIVTLLGYIANFGYRLQSA